MANIEDYVKWRGDLSFTADAFNEIDSLILTQLSYLELEGIVPSWKEKRSISMPKLIEAYFLKNTPAEIAERAMIIQNPARLLNVLKKSRRFSELQFANYKKIVDKERQEQFSAMTVWIPDGSIYVAYSGTDNTMIGWRENFNMTFMDSVPAQREAAQYLQDIYDWSNFQLRLGGHSKGGNLAVYAAIYASPEISSRIIGIDNFDGPGFLGQILQHPEYHKTLARVKTYVPQTAIVGRILEHSQDFLVVKSVAKGAWQHDAFSWQVQGNGYVLMKSLNAESDRMENTLNAWLEHMTLKERERFVNILFALLDQAQIKTVNDLSGLNLKNIFEILKRMTDLDEKSKKELKYALKLLWKGASEMIGQELSNK